MLRYLIAASLLPPGLFVVALVVLGGMQLRKKQRRNAAATLAIAAALWALSTSVVSDRLIRVLEAPFDGVPVPSGDVIILLTGGAYGGATDLTGVGSPSSDTLFRVVTAARLERRLGVPVLVSGGKVFEGLAPEAPIARRFLVDLGVPEERVLVEDQSRDTEENARAAAEICAKRGFQRPILVSSGYHLLRARGSFERAGLAVSPYPGGLIAWKDKHFVWHDYLPTAQALKVSAIALRELLGLAYHALAA